MSLGARAKALCVEAVTVAALAALAIYPRTSMYAQVFADGEVTPVEVDAFLHLRRALRAVESFPTVPLREPLVGPSPGAVFPWPEGFDWCLAALARMFGGDDPARAAAVIAWAPVALGVAVTLGVYALVRRLLRGDPDARGASLLAGAVMALVPQSVATSVVGRVDHHVAEQAAAVALLAWCLARPSPDASRAVRVRFELVGAAALGLSLWCFNGSVLYAAVAAGVLGLRALAETGRAHRLGLGGLAFGLSSAFVACRAAPAVHMHGRAFDHLYTSFLQPVVLLASGALVLAAGEVARRDRVDGPRRVAVRAAVLASLVAAACVAVAALAPALRREVVEGARRWLARDDGYMRGIDEVQPLLSGGGGAARVYRTFGVAGFAHPIAVVAALWGLARRRRGALELGAFWTSLAALTLLQMRFGRVLAPVAAVALGVGAWAAASRLREVASLRRVAFVTPWTLLALWSLDPRARAWLARRPPAVADEVRAARFLRGASGARDRVFTAWPDGNAVLVVARRPVLVTSFGSYVDGDTFWRCERAWLGSASALDELLARHGARWIVAGAEHFGGAAVSADAPPAIVYDAAGRARFNAVFFQRVPLAALVLGGGGAPRAGVAHLEHWMPRFSAGAALRSRDHAVPSLWVYERVAGAVVQGGGPEGALVTLSTRLDVDGAPDRHVAWTRVAGGRFALRTALPTRWRSAGLATPEPAALAVGDGPTRVVDVPEDAVRAGTTIEVAAGP